MDVVAFLPPLLLSNLRVVLGTRHPLTVVGSWGELHRAVQHNRASGGVVVADPQADGVDGVAALEDVRRHLPSFPIVVYTQLAPASMQSVVRLARIGIEHVVLSRFDDEPGQFLMLLEGIPLHALSDRMLHELNSSLAMLPAAVVRAIERLFRSPDHFKNAQDLATAADMNLRTLYRSLDIAGIFSARTLVVSARLLRAYALLQDPGRSIKDVAANAGYHSPWQLSQQFRALTGQTPKQVRHGMTSDVLISLLAEQLRRGRSA